MIWDKTDIIKYLSDQRGYRNYLEICTPTTGGKFAKIDRSQFHACHRLMYRCPETFTDGLNIDFRVPDLGISRCVADIHRGALRYDIILVDSWHEYEPSFRDMHDALNILAYNGSIVIHDCLPPTDDIISPTWTPGAWCGVTFMAYVDFVTQNIGLQYCTIDTDYGCGVVQKCRDRQIANAFHDLLAPWKELSNDSNAAFQFVQKHRTTLLGLISVDEFVRTEAEIARRRIDRLMTNLVAMSKQVTEQAMAKEKLQADLESFHADLNARSPVAETTNGRPLSSIT